MSVKIEKQEKNNLVLEIVVSQDKFNEAVKKSYKKNVGKYNIPGFRKGKAPMNIIKKMYGDGVFYEDAINYCIDDTYGDALKELNIEPVDYPKIDVKEVGEDKDLVYTAGVTTKPEVELGEYTGLNVEKQENIASEEQIDSEIQSKLEMNSRIITREDGDTVHDKDSIKIDFKGFVDGVAFEGGEAKDYALVIGSKSFIDTFEEQLIGAKKDEQVEVNVKFPEEYGMETLNGKEAHFEVVVKEIQYKELPELNDEFVKDTTEFETVAEFRADIESKIKKNNETRILREHENKIIDEICEKATVEVPDVMIEREIDLMIKDLENKLKYQGLDLESYYKHTDSSEEKTREYMKENATKKVTGELVLEEIAKKENIEVSDEDVEVKAKEYAESYPEADREKAFTYFKTAEYNTLKRSLVNEKTIEFLVSNN